MLVIKENGIKVKLKVYTDKKVYVEAKMSRRQYDVVCGTIKIFGQKATLLDVLVALDMVDNSMPEFILDYLAEMVWEDIEYDDGIFKANFSVK